MPFIGHHDTYIELMNYIETIYVNHNTKLRIFFRYFHYKFQYRGASAYKLADSTQAQRN
jgi:hypothetical protein